MAGKDLNDLFLDGLRDVYHAEKQIMRTLPKMAKSTEMEELRAAFEQHLEETRGQIERLEQVFEMVNKRASGKPCEAMQGLVEEGKEIMEEFEDSPALDAGLIATAQAIEHYEIARYGTLKAWAEQLGMDEAVELLEETLAEEKRTDELLTKLALEEANRRAEAGEEEDEDEDEEA